MKQLSLLIALALAACSGGNKPAPAQPPGPGADPAAPRNGCAQEIAIRCMAGVDGCEGNKTTEHICVPADAKVGPPCEQEIALVCPEDQIDGCLRNPRVSANHICVYK